MFQEGSGGVPTDSPLTLGTLDLPRLTLTGGRGTLQAVHHSRAIVLDKGPLGTASVLGPAADPHWWNITPAAEAEGHLPTKHLTARRTGRGIRPKESAPDSCLAGARCGPCRY